MWKDKILDLVKDFEHPAWGFSHFTRIHELSLKLAKEQSLVVDYDSLYAAAYLHDIGAFKPYSQKGRDHSDVAIEICDEILASTDFPLDKIPLVKEIIKSHMFYAEVGGNIESKIFHDADTLDFLGVIGITRLLSIVGIADWTPNLKSAIDLIEKFSKDLPHKLHTELAKEMGKYRQKEMRKFLVKLKNETNNLVLI
ncbi:MAG: HD domain-containing protein [Promethearchaeota archaeon]